MFFTTDFALSIWFISLTAYQLLLGYLMLKFDHLYMV